VARATAASVQADPVRDMVLDMVRKHLETRAAQPGGLDWKPVPRRPDVVQPSTPRRSALAAKARDHARRPAWPPCSLASSAGSPPIASQTEESQ
jgi:hypothetical protein